MLLRHRRILHRRSHRRPILPIGRMDPDHIVFVAAMALLIVFLSTGGQL